MLSKITLYSCAVLTAFVIYEISALQWASSDSLPDGGKVISCIGQTLTLNWTYILESGESIDDIQWHYKHPGQQDQLEALLVDGNILTLPGARHSYVFISNAGVQLTNVTSEDSGLYSVHVNLHSATSNEFQTVDVQVSGPETCLSTTERLEKCQSSHNDLTSRLGVLTSTGQQHAATILTLTRQLETCENRDQTPASTTPPPTYPPWFRPADCRDVKLFNDTTGIYSVYLRNVTPVNVFCDQDFDDGGWLVIQRRFDGSENFYRTWAEYARGFGDLRYEFWLGLSAISDLTKDHHWSLRIDLEDFEGNRLYAEYSRFYVEPESSYFRLYAYGYSGTAGDSLSVNRGHYFSTYDRDHDGNSRIDCAQTMHGGWWYDECGQVNLNGQYKLAQGFGLDNVVWQGAYGGKPIKRTEMKIKPLPAK